MRKIIMVVSTLVLVSMLLVACAGEETATTVPSTDAPPMTEAPTMEETVSPDDGTGTPVGGIPVTGEEDPSRLSNQLDYTVWNQNGEQIGEVNDMVVDLEDTSISYVIVGTGGFLEIGEKDIFVPWDSLQLSTEGGDMTGDNQFAFILQADQDIFTNAPDVDVNIVLPALGEPANDWDAEIRTYWEGGGAAAPDTSTTGTPGTGTDPSTVATGTPSTGTGSDMTATPSTGAGLSTTETPSAGATANPNATAMPVEPGASMSELQGVVLASELLGSTVTVSADGQVSGGLNENQGQAQGTGTPQAPAQPVTTGTPGTGTGSGTATTTTPSTGTGSSTTATPGADSLATGTPATGAGGTGTDQVVSATIDDVIVDVDSGEILYIVLNTSLDSGERWIPVPLSQFQFDPIGGSFVFSDASLMLQDAPFFEDGQFPSTMEEGWDRDFSDFWGSNGSGSGGGASPTATP